MHLRSLSSGECQSGCEQRAQWARPAPRRQQPAREAAAGVQIDSQARLTVQTAEGDRVVLSLGARTKLSGARHETAGGSAQVNELSHRSRVGVQVQGSLNDEELADIGELISALGEFQQSGGAGAAAFLQQAAGLDSLAGFDYRYSRSVQAGALIRLEA